MSKTGEQRIARAEQEREELTQMRPGLPTFEAWETHGGKDAFWVVQWKPEGYVNPEWFDGVRSNITIAKLSMQIDSAGCELSFATTHDMRTTRGYQIYRYNDRSEPDLDWRFWPCDEHGNKVPWPRTEPTGQEGGNGQSQT